MSREPDPELEDLFADDPSLLRTARLLQSSHHPGRDPDAEFAAALRRRLMEEAAELSGGRQRRRSGFRAWLAGLSLLRIPTLGGVPAAGMAVAGAALCALLVVAAFVALQGPPGSPNGPGYGSPLNHAQEVGLVTPIEVHFNQPMDRASVESAVHIQPATPVKEYRWRGNVLEIVPQHNLAPNTRYQVVVDPHKARTATDHPLASAPVITFKTTPSKGHHGGGATPRPSASPPATGSPAPTASPEPSASPMPSASSGPSGSPAPTPSTRRHTSPGPSSFPGFGSTPGPSASPRRGTSPSPRASPTRSTTPRGSPSVRPVGLTGSSGPTPPVSSPRPSASQGTATGPTSTGTDRRQRVGNGDQPSPSPGADASSAPDLSLGATPVPRPHPSRGEHPEGSS